VRTNLKSLQWPSSAGALRRGSDAPGHRLVAVDGLRAIAVAAVMAFHFDLPLHGGFFGVDLFFAISGFVIARGLLQAAATDQSTAVIMRRFYARRAGRLLPAVIVVAVATVALAALRGSSFGSLGRTVAHAFAAVGGGANWFVVAFPDQPGEVVRPLLHTWSLGVEEQCYLLLPLALLLVPRSRARAVAVALGVFGAVVALGFAWWFPSPDVSFFATPARLAPVGFGVALAGLLAGCDLSDDASLAGARRWSGRLIAALAVCLLPALLFAGWRDPWLYRGGFVVVGFIATAIVGAAALPGRGLVSSVLKSAPLRWVADRSYCLYLVHFPIAYLFGSFGLGPRTALRVVASFACAEVVHRFVEYRFLDASTAKRTSWAFGPVVMATASVFGFALFRMGTR
jgi:peptidoglycan/LPS O-acetylase OafA/YrhL